MSINRRDFMKESTALGLALSIPGTLSVGKKPLFKLSLKPSAVGIKGGMMENTILAKKYGFEAISPNSHQLLEMSEKARKELRQYMSTQQLSWGCANLPVDFRKDLKTFNAGVKELPKHAKALQEMGVNRIGTWVMPRHAELTYLQNLKQHTERLAEVASILGDYDLRFGLEYVAPKTMWADRKYTFVRTMPEMLELIDQIDQANVGMILDSFHWFCANDTLEDIRKLKNDQVIACDWNDAFKGRSRDEQIDGQRELPMASGEIDMKAFVEALVDIGYDGPVRAEPFNKALNSLDNEDAASKTAAAMKATASLVK